MRLLTGKLVAVTAVVLAIAGCDSGPAPYTTRMAYLDKMAAKGIDYRGQLQQQGTPVSTAACEIGWSLLKPGDIPYDADGYTRTDTWLSQVEEAYVKGCLTGNPRPKPEPSGINAVTPVPVSPRPASTASASPSH